VRLAGTVAAVDAAREMIEHSRWLLAGRHVEFATRPKSASLLESWRGPHGQAVRATGSASRARAKSAGSTTNTGLGIDFHLDLDLVAGHDTGGLPVGNAEAEQVAATHDGHPAPPFKTLLDRIGSDSIANSCNDQVSTNPIMLEVAT
jgi:hypothetical protein